MSDEAPKKARPAGGKPPISAPALVSLGLSLAAIAVVFVAPVFDSAFALTAAAVVVAGLSAAGLIMGAVSYVKIVKAEGFVVGKGFALWAMAIGGFVVLFMAIVIFINLKAAEI